jgi:hypothetical protein
MHAPSLRELQIWMRWVVTDPRGTDEAIKDPNPVGRSSRYQAPKISLPASVFATITSTPLASREARLDIYAEAYFARLAEVASMHYPHTKRVLGEKEFMIAVSEFLKVNPSRKTNIDEVFDSFPAFLASSHPAINHICVSELASAEALLVNATIYFIPGDSIVLEKLNAISDWPKARFIFRNGVSIVRSQYRLDNILDGSTEFINEPSSLLIHFRGAEVRYTPLLDQEAALLIKLQNGMTLDDALGDLSGPAILPEKITEWFASWMAREIFREITDL